MKIMLTELFSLSCRDLSKLKREVIASLGHILYSRKENKEEEKKIY